jgi:hypothetical protein
MNGASYMVCTRWYVLMTSADELVIRAFVSLDLEAMKSKSCLFGEMCRYDDNGGEERRSGGEVKREEA